MIKKLRVFVLPSELADVISIASCSKITANKIITFCTCPVSVKKFITMVAWFNQGFRMH